MAFDIHRLHLVRLADDPAARAIAPASAGRALARAFALVACVALHPALSRADDTARASDSLAAHADTAAATSAVTAGSASDHVPPAPHAGTTTAPGATTAGATAAGTGAVPASPAASTMPVATAPAVAHSTGVAGPGTAFSPPASLDDVSAWLDYRAHNHISSLPQEARIYYRRGLMLSQSGSIEDAIRLVRAASELDPEFVAPHLTLASWFLVREPSQALQQYAAVLELARENFVLQLSLAANAIYLFIQALFLGLLATALIIVWLHNAELRHAWQERLAGFIAAPGARIWAWSFLVLPFFFGFGLTLPVLVFLGLLWPLLRIRERVLFVSFVLVLAAAPWITGTLDKLSAPLRSDEGPLFAVPTMAGEAYSPERQQELVALADSHPGDGFAQFALGWIARRGGDLPLAERAYRRALALWPANDRVMNNLGNTLALQGRPDEALALFQKASAADPRNASAYFNASQIYTQRFEYHAANEALSRASALNFDLVKSYQSQATEDGLLPLIDQWLAPRTFWESLSLVAPGGARREMLPPGWRGHLECSGWGFSVVVVLLAIGSLLLGRSQQQGMPVRACNNCERIICRRCAERRREIALCAHCAAAEAPAESPEFARVLLLQRRRAVQKQRSLVRTALAALIPGYGMLALNRAFLPLVLLTVTGALTSGWIGLRTPFFYEPRVLETGNEIPLAVTLAQWIFVYAVSLLGYMVARARSDARALSAPAAGQGRQDKPARRVTAAAA
jgi:tetratricopeptide (TPR) repeat protein